MYPMFCGCTLISNSHALTAAHCTDKQNPEDFQIRFGSDCHDRGGIVVKVDKIRQHPNYDSSKRKLKYDFDISVLKLDESLNNLIPSIGFADQDEIYRAGTTTWVAGWGSLRPNEQNFYDNVRFLHSAQIELLSFRKCNQNYAKSLGYGLSERMTCAGDFDGGVGTCQG